MSSSTCKGRAQWPTGESRNRPHEQYIRVRTSPAVCIPHKYSTSYAMRTSFFAFAAVAFGAVSSAVGQGTPQLVSPTANSEIGLHQFVEYERPGHLVSEATHIELTLSNSTWSDFLTPAPTFSPGNGPQYIAQGNVNIDPAEWAEGAYNFTVQEISPFFGTIATITIPVILNYSV